MNPKLEEAYASVGKGWHGLLNKYLPKIYSIDPDCELVVKEKYGTLRIQPYRVSNGVSRSDIYAIANKAEKASAKICEACGAPGTLRTTDGWWWSTLCAQCATGGRCTPLEEFPEDGLHPETERVIAEHLEAKDRQTE